MGVTDAACVGYAVTEAEDGSGDFACLTCGVQLGRGEIEAHGGNASIVPLFTARCQKGMLNLRMVYLMRPPERRRRNIPKLPDPWAPQK